MITVWGYKNCSIAKKIFENLVILNGRLDCFFVSILFFRPETQICIFERIYFDREHMLAAMWNHTFFKYGFLFLQDNGQNKTNGIIEIMMTKNARIRRHLRLPGYSL